MSIRKPQDSRHRGKAESRDFIFPEGLVLDLTTDDFDELSSVAPCWDQEYLKLGKGAFKGSLHGIHTARLQLGMVSWDPGILVKGSSPPQTVTLASLLRKEGAASFQGTVLEENQLIVLRPGQDFELSAVGRHKILVVVVEQELFQDSVLTRRGAPILLHNKQDRLVLKDPSAQGAMDRMWEELLAENIRHRRLLVNPSYARSLEQSVIEQLVSASQGPNRLPLGPKRRVAALTAKEYLDSHTEEPVSIADLCAVANTNERTLLLGFHEVFGIPPKVYLKSIRLNRVRQELRSAPQDTTVTDVAIRWGFTHLSRFAADYRKMFGEFPHVTLKNVARPNR